MNFFIVSDQEYLERAIVLLQCLNVHHPTSDIYAHLINVSDADADSIFGCHENVKIFKRELRSFDSIESKRAYCANVRALSICRLLPNLLGPLLYLDVDSIIRRNLSDLFSQIEAHDITIHFRPEAPQHMRVATGVIGFGNSSTALTICEIWANLIRVEDRIFNWFSDQIYLNDAITQIASVRASHLEKAFIDWDFSDSSAIWVGKGPRKFSAAYLDAERLASRSSR